jgi:hypothetical protein
MLRYEEAPPPEPLRPFVHALWTFCVPEGHAPFLHHVPPDGCVSLAIILSAAPRRASPAPHPQGNRSPLHP